MAHSLPLSPTGPPSDIEPRPHLTVGRLSALLVAVGSCAKTTRRVVIALAVAPLLFATAGAPAVAQEAPFPVDAVWALASSPRGDAVLRLTDLEVGPQGSTFVGATFGDSPGDSLYYGNGQIATVQGAQAGVVAKYAVDGTLEWARFVQGASPQARIQLGGVAAMPDGGVAVLGSVVGAAAYVDGGPVGPRFTVFIRDNISETFVARYLPDGALAWVRQVTPGTTALADITADDAGRILVPLKRVAIVGTGTSAVSPARPPAPVVVVFETDGTVRSLAQPPGMFSGSEKMILSQTPGGFLPLAACESPGSLVHYDLDSGIREVDTEVLCTGVSGLPGGGVALAGYLNAPVRLGIGDGAVTLTGKGYVLAYDACGALDWTLPLTGTVNQDRVSRPSTLAALSTGEIVVMGDLHQGVGMTAPLEIRESVARTNAFVLLVRADGTAEAVWKMPVGPNYGTLPSGIAAGLDGGFVLAVQIGGVGPGTVLIPTAGGPVTVRTGRSGLYFLRYGPRAATGGVQSGGLTAPSSSATRRTASERVQD